MQIDEIRSKWKLLTGKPTTNGLISIRISAECLPQLFIGRNDSGNRGLILSLDKNIEHNYRSCLKEKISIEYMSDKKLIVLLLNDHNFFDLFDELILSIVNHISDVTDANLYPIEMFRTFHKWSAFFEDRKSERLPQEVIKGLWGELFVLKNELIKSKSPLLYDVILTSWRGPYDEGHDFVKDQKDIEVKTKEYTQQQIHISSEFQLNEEHGKTLELHVLSVESDQVNGFSMNDILLEIKDILYNGGDFSILLTALMQKNITLYNITEYDLYKYTPIESVTYNCCSENFPRLTRDNLHLALRKVRYELLLSELSEHVIDTHKYHLGSK